MMTNIEKLTDYINDHPNPQQFLRLLSAFCKPGTDNFANGEQEMEVTV